MIDIQKIIKYVNNFHFGNNTVPLLKTIYNLSDIINKEFLLIPVEGVYIYQYKEHYVKEPEILDIIGVEKPISFPCISYFTTLYNCPFCIIKNYITIDGLYTFNNFTSLIQLDNNKYIFKMPKEIANLIYQYLTEETKGKILKLKIDENGCINLIDTLPNMYNYTKEIFYKQYKKNTDLVIQKIDDIIEYLKNLIGS